MKTGKKAPVFDNIKTWLRELSRGDQNLFNTKFPKFRDEPFSLTVAELSKMKQWILTRPPFNK